MNLPGNDFYPERSIGRMNPLAYMGSGTVLAEKSGTLWKVDLPGGKKERLGRFPFSFKENVLGGIRLAARFLRTGVRYGIATGDGCFVLVRGRRFYRFDAKCGRLDDRGAVPAGSRPLNMLVLKDFPGFEDGVFYGEYGSSREEHPVSICRLSEAGSKGCFTFPAGTVGHVHNLVADPFRRCVWVLTGDFGAAAGIWMATDSFRRVEPVLTGHQQYRACCAWATEAGLLYATDSPLEKNSIRLLEKSEAQWRSRELEKTAGPVIYGCRAGGRYVFSTSVEGSGNSISRFNVLFGRKPGPALADDFVHFYSGTPEAGFREFRRVRKDVLPFVPFQFGAAVFPTGEDENWLCWRQIATRSEDMNMLAGKL